ncbi:unnamed protein product [Mytilus coruscus]|uniref:B box-type domain-containing protein n=1 Tax=Mytilus coruscus TaxID=42192 RepID=A0A6J8CSK1_MYTCO|nr:unnamed protein product [Mytilus coruscus]
MDVNDKKDLCSPCEFKSKTEIATKWCIECKEPLCVSCNENHSAHRSSRNHHVISIEGNKMLESLQIPLNEYCEVHDQEKDLFCTSHSEVICLTCTQTTHGKCEPAVRLSDVTKSAKTSTFVSMIDTKIVDVVDELRDIIRDRENNKVEIEKQKTEILDTVKNYRKCINDKLDQVENIITEDLNEKCESSNLEIDNNVKFLNDHLNKFDEIRKKMDILKEYASDTQTFIGTRALEKTLHYNESMLTSFLELIQNINIDIEKNRGQYPIDHRLKLSKALEIKIPQESFFKSTILSCIILPNKQMIFVDSHARNKRLIVLNEDGTHDRNINLTSKPFDIAVIDNNKIALSFPWNTHKRIGIINMTNNKSEPDIFFKNKCYGISYDKDRLFVVVKTEGILIMDLSGKLSACLPIEGIGIFYVHVKNDRLYCSDECNDTVQCYDMQGCSIWTFKDSNLGSPRSISSDDKFILIAGCKTNNVVSLYLNGSFASVICDTDDGIIIPTSLYFDSDNLLV